MRLRVVRPDFWSDETLGHLADSPRLFYIGLWCVADDAGWLEWRPAQIGATLYPYRPPHRRQRDIEGWGEALVQAGRLVLYPCGCGYIPTLVKHQRQGGNPTFQYREKHRRHVADNDQESRQVYTDTSLGNRGKGREGREGKARATDWDQKIVELRRHGDER